MSHCQQRCKRQLGRVIRFFYQFVTGTLSQGKYRPGGRGDVCNVREGVCLVSSVGLFEEGRMLFRC